MNSNEFVDAIKQTVGQSAITDINKTLEKPSGRSPNPKLVRLSAWYNELSAVDKGNLKEVISLTVDHSIFGILCVLDGVRVIENGSNKGELVLEYHKDGQKTRLNGEGDMLHDIYNAE